MREISDKGMEFIARWEGKRLSPYKDTKGIWTIGYGNTYYADGQIVRESDPPITHHEAKELFRIIVNRFVKRVDNIVRKDISQDMFDMLVSLAYNIGIGRFLKSTVRRLINQDPNHPDIAEAWGRYNKERIDGVLQFNRGLDNRRKAEIKTAIRNS
jgi:lysozyme